MEKKTMTKLYTRNRLFAYLAGAALSLSSGAVRAAVVPDELAALPGSVLEDILDEADGDTWKSEDKMVLMSVLSRDKRPDIRMRVSEMLISEGASIPFSKVEPILLNLADDSTPKVRFAAAKALANTLAHVDPSTRIRTVSEWSSSDRPNVRQAVALAVGL
jgi:HEAT repeat protein